VTVCGLFELVELFLLHHYKQTNYNIDRPEIKLSIRFYVIVDSKQKIDVMKVFKKKVKAFT
jgi:hypothetical protein